MNLRLFTIGLLFAMAVPASAYDPLSIPKGTTVSQLDLTVHDQARNRDIPLRVYLPRELGPRPVVLFSHGLGGSRLGYAYLGEHWAARGYVAVHLQHPGSDDAVWRNVPVGRRMAAMRQAASLRNFELRVRDVPAVLDQLTQWNKEANHPLHSRLDLAHVGMAGHSFGAVTTQAVSGQAYGAGQKPFTDPRIKAAIVMSPSAGRQGLPARAPSASFGAVAIPWLLMTGTKDTAPIGEVDAASRQAVFPALPPGDKYEVVLYNAEHSAFSDGPLPGDREPRNPHHHQSILALSTAFWDAYLMQDKAALAWLKGAGPRGVLDAKDTWHRK